MKPTRASTAASVNARLKNEAAKNAESFNPMLTRYVGFRLLYRLSISRYADKFLIKGATRFIFWTSSIHRPTRDIDLLSLSHADLDEIRDIFVKLCQLECPEDGVLFDPDSVTSELIREEQAYGGSRIKLTGFLGKARVPLQIDVGIGDAVTPGPVEVVIPAVISGVPEARVRGYPVESAIAEKFHAMTVLGINNSRMKDFYDVAFLADSVPLDPALLREAIIATFDRRKTHLPREVPICLRKELTVDHAVSNRWRAFVRKNSITAPYDDLEYIQSRLSELLLPIIEDQRSS
jgi:predicted nucleotidyltransferase component of viral defense system